MSDHSPWMPPADGEPESPLPTRDDQGEPVPAAPLSPWARPADGEVVEFDTSSSIDGADPSSPPVIADHVSTLSPAPPLAAPPIGTPPAAEPGSERSVPSVVGVPDEQRRSRLLMLTAVVAVVAIGLAGIFAVSRFTDASTSGGETPEALGERLLSAIESEDVLGMIDTLLPGERESLGQPFIDAISELKRLEVLSSDLELSRLLGVDVELSNEVVSSTSTNVDDIAHLALGADVVATLDGANLPIGDLMIDRLPADVLTEVRRTRTTETDRFDVELTVVESEGRWYISLLHTAAEAARSELGGAPIPAVGLPAAGGSSPDDAVDRLLSGISNLDVRGLIQLLDPSEAMALQRYAPLVLGDAEAAASEFTGSINVSDHQFRFEGSGGRRTAFIDAFTVEIADDGETATMTYGGGCWRVESSAMDEPMEMCTDLGAAAIEGLDVPAEIQELFDVVTDAFADMADVGIEMRARDGEWFFSPMATVTEAMLSAMRALDRPELDRIIDAVPPALESLLPWVFGGFEELTGEEIGGGWFADREMSETIDGSAGELDPITPMSATDRCYGLIDVDEAQACFDEALATGLAEPWEVPVSMRFPECGLSGVFWSVGYYEMSDADFTATMADAAVCFERLANEGEIEWWEVPFEVSNLECFEGRNWYAVNDGDFVDRVFTCMDELAADAGG